MTIDITNPRDFTTFLHTWVMAPRTLGVVCAVPEVAIAAAVAGDAPAGGAPAIAPILGFTVIPTEIMYKRPDGVIE